jgi:hypothetical protein
VRFPVYLASALGYSHRIADQSLQVTAITTLALWCSVHITIDCDKQGQFRLSLRMNGKSGPVSANSLFYSNLLSIH